MTDVKCKVESCYYWGQGDICRADSIMVDNNKRSAPLGRMEAGNLDVNENTGRSSVSPGGTDKNQATRSEETLCKTFRPKTQTNR